MVTMASKDPLGLVAALTPSLGPDMAQHLVDTIREMPPEAVEAMAASFPKLESLFRLPDAPRLAGAAREPREARFPRIRRMVERVKRTLRLGT